MPNGAGTLADVVLGFDTLAEYESGKNPYFGCTTGRLANRTRAGQFTLDGRRFQLSINDPPNHIHGGGRRSLDRVVWHAEAVASGSGADGGSAVRFTYTSPDQEEGYPGNLAIEVTYTLTADDALRIDYEATTDQPTPVNLTSHTYWNLAGGGTVRDHELTLHARYYTPTDATLIPTGQILPVAATPLDFTCPAAVGLRLDELARIPAQGYDHNFVVDGTAGTLRPAARLADPASGRLMELQTTEPGVQFYSGNRLEGQPGKQGRSCQPHGAVCLETQHYPDSVHHAHFPSVILRPGQTYRQTTVHRFGFC